MGSNMAENHPVGFQWVMEARERGARVFHVDPRFTRTSAMCTDWIRIRAGSDIAFLGGVVNYILSNERHFEEYVKHYTNAPVVIDEAYQDTEDLDGLFSGWDPEEGKYDPTTWQYSGMKAHGAAGQREEGFKSKGEQSGHGGHGGGLEHGEPPEEDITLQHERCVFQLLKKHFARYTPEFVSETCGCSVEQFLDYCEAVCSASGPEKTGSFCYAVGWTQHTVGVQYIRTAAIIQQLLGNIGRPGGGIMALRGHASIQGSTDIPTLYNILPGYLPMPHTESYGGFDNYMEANTSPTGFWGNFKSYWVSLMKAYFGRERDRRQRLALRVPAACRRRQLGVLDGAADARRQGEGLHHRRREPGRREHELEAAPARPRQARLARRPRRGRDRVRGLLVRQPRDRVRRPAHRGDPDGDLLPAGGDAHGEGRLVHQHAADAAVALEGGRAEGGLPLGPLVLLPPRPDDQAEARRLRGEARHADQGAALGVPDALARSRSRTPRPSSQEVSGWEVSSGEFLDGYPS